MLVLFTKTYDMKQEVMPFISAAEMVKKFESRTRELDLSQNRSLSHVLFISLLIPSIFLSIATFKIFNPLFFLGPLGSVFLQAYLLLMDSSLGLFNLFKFLKWFEVGYSMLSILVPLYACNILKNQFSNIEAYGSSFLC